MRELIVRYAVWLVALSSVACGGTEVNEKAQRLAQQFYEAAYTSYFEQQDTLLAIRNLVRAIDKDPNNHYAHCLLGTIRLGRGEYEDADKHLTEAVRLRLLGNTSELAEARNGLGVLRIHQKRYRDAIELLDASAQEVLNREPWLALGNLGWAYIELGEYDKAIDVLRRSMFDQPKFCVGMYRMGQAYYLKRDYGNAEAALLQAVGNKEPGCDRLQDAFHLLGMAQLRLGKDAEAKDAFTRCRNLGLTPGVGVACAQAL